MERRLTAERCCDRIASVLNVCFEHASRLDRRDDGDVSNARACQRRRRVVIDTDNLDALIVKPTHGLHAGVIEFRSLSDNNGS
jgi:hypothetical protein